MNKNLVDIKTETNNDGTIQVEISHDSFNESIEKTIKKYIYYTLNEETMKNMKNDILDTIKQYYFFKELMKEERDDKNEIFYSING
jgi:competence transcription factor ComK